jgi:hypothetical protein
MRKTFTAAALLAVTVGGIAAGTGAASAQESGTDTATQGGAERVLPALGGLPGLDGLPALDELLAGGDLLGPLPLLGGGTGG